MADPKQNTPMPGVAPKPVRHRVLYMRTEPTAGFQPVGSYALGNKDAEQQGEYLFSSIRSDLINKARAAAAPVPFFLEQTEEGGLKKAEG